MIDKITETLETHSRKIGKRDATLTCKCGYRSGLERSDPKDTDAHTSHQAEELAKLVPASAPTPEPTKRKGVSDPCIAWEQGFALGHMYGVESHGVNLGLAPGPVTRPTNPYRSAEQ